MKPINTNNVFVISDTHFYHDNICRFKYTNEGGELTKLRPWSTLLEMHEQLVLNWNKVVSPGDIVYHLGDVSMNNQDLKIMERLNGNKILVGGNHDSLTLKTYAKYFKDIKGCKVHDNYILTHIPVHPNSLARWKGNVHGHTHSHSIRCEGGAKDIRYIPVSVEQIDYTPLAWDILKERHKRARHEAKVRLSSGK